MDDRNFYDIYIAPRGGAALAVAVRTGLLEWLDGGARTAAEIGRKFGWRPRPTDSFLTALTGLGVLERLDHPNPGAFFDPGDRYALTAEAAAHLVPGKPEDLSGLIGLEFESFVTPKGLLEAMERDVPRVYGDSDPWEAHGESGEKARDFARAMRSISARPALRLAEAEFWASRRHLLDVGGGSGIFATSCLRRWPELRATVFEIPAVCPLALELAAEEGVAERFDSVAGDMFADAWPRGADAVLLSQILHDWPPEKGAELLRRAYQSLEPGGIVVVHEKLLDPERTGPRANALVSLDMLFWTEGQQYSVEQIKSALAEAGFVEVVVMPTIGYWSVAIGVRG
jgi:SAM-dependent methyltransferase